MTRRLLDAPLGIGTPSDIEHFILFGLSAGGVVVSFDFADPQIEFESPHRVTFEDPHGLDFETRHTVSDTT